MNELEQTLWEFERKRNPKREYSFPIISLPKWMKTANSKKK
jgi:hypothetical protein